MSYIPPKAGMRYFSRVKEARAVLKEKAKDILDMQIQIIQLAIAKGDFETAAKANQFLLTHMTDDDGQHLLDMDVDKPKQVEQHSGPQISIGFALGGIPQSQQALPAVIDITPKSDDDDKDPVNNS